jgi:CheY-like chemotaxis protein
MKILLIDDSRTIRWENQRALEEAGYDVVCAEDGESALRIAQQESVDLILLDLMLPRMTGTEVLRRLKSAVATADIPVIVLSGLCAKNRDKLMEEGAEEYLEKNSLMPGRGQNLLPKILENVICRINRRRGIAFSKVPIHN